MGFRLRDTLSGKRRTVRARPGRPVALYVCGPTVYDVAHVGHGRTYLFFDVIRRGFDADRVPLRYVMNVTDFEDKLEVRATQLGLSWRALARREERGFFRDLAALGVRLPTLRPRASDFVPEMVRIGQRLERTGRVRREGNEWIYSPPARPARANFPTTSQLADHAVAEPGHPFPARQEAAGEFTIWRLQDPPRPSWPSPWGRGVPGWHLECYAMAQKYLGVPVDLHGGGLDLIYPHHYAENEIALEFRGEPFSRLFLHTAFVLTGGAKMSKSAGNLVSLRSALRAVGAGPLRWYLLSTPYTRRLSWDEAALARATSEFAALRRAARRWVGTGAGGRDSAATVRRLAAGVRSDLANNLATDRAFGRLRSWARALAKSPDQRVARAHRASAVRALRDITARTGLPLL
jgi:cysteinyl-tRNA synthetase